VLSGATLAVNAYVDRRVIERRHASPAFNDSDPLKAASSNAVTHHRRSTTPTP